MMTLTYQSAAGKTITFGSAPYLLTGVDGLHGLSANVHSFTQYLQDGTTYVASQLQPRSITIASTIMTDVVANRIAVLEAMTPKEMGTLTLRRGDFVRRIACVVEQAPAFNQNNGAKFSVTLYAPNPYWVAESESRTEVAAWEGAFEWPLEFPAGGFEFGFRTLSRIVNVYNAGDADMGMRVSFVANGSVTTPSLVDVNTYQHIKVHATLSAKERIDVNTVVGQKYVRLYKTDGTTQNVFDKLNPASEFLQLKRGDNLFRFDAEAGGDRLDVIIYYQPRYVGV